MFFEHGLIGLLMRTSAMRPRAPAVASGTNIVLDYQTLMERVEMLSGWFQGQGFTPGERVVIFLKNQPAWLEIMFACWHAGLVVVPVNVKLHARELLYILNDAAPVCMFFDEDNNEAQAALRETTSLLAIPAASSEDTAILQEKRGNPVENAPNSLAWLFYTSGTTGRPKGAMLSHSNLLAMAQLYSTDVEPEGVGEALLHAAPMSHGSGLYILPHVLHGSLNICPESRGFDIAEIEHLLNHYKKVSFFAAPTMVTRLTLKARGDLPGLHTIICGGAPMYASDAQAAIKRFGKRLAQIYGQGETPMTITALPKSLHDVSRPDLLLSCGFPQTGVLVRVVDAEGQTLGSGEIGEIIVKGPTVMTGYWNLAEATQKTLRDGWLYTGDVGMIGEQGELILKDRSKEVIISGGSNIYPREVEEVLLRHAAVEEVAVIGLSDPDWGEVVTACVVPKDNHIDLIDELNALCAENIARFKHPKKYILLESLPKNATGKIMKRELRDQCAIAA